MAIPIQLMRGSVCLAVVLTVLYYLVPYALLVDKEWQDDSNGDDFAAAMSKIDWALDATRAPPRYAYNRTTGTYEFGRWTRPVRRCNVHHLNFAQSILQYKRWLWTAVSTQNTITAAAILQFGYINAVMFFHHDTVSGTTWKRVVEIPGGVFVPWTSDVAMTIADNACSTWATAGVNMYMCTRYGTLHIHYTGTDSVGSSKAKLEVDMSMPLNHTDMFSMVYPLGPRRPAMTTKVGGIKGATARVVIDGEERVATTQQQQGLGMFDFTRALAKRHTIWKWTTFSFVDEATKRAVGVHMSADTYPSARGVSMESFATVDGALTEIPCQVVFERQQRAAADDAVNEVETWTLSAPCVHLSATFAMSSQFPSILNFGVVHSNLFHKWGMLRSVQLTIGGTVYKAENVPAVLEDHDSLW
eukprot:PhM_4_TR15606/c0_g1_i1/m.13850